MATIILKDGSRQNLQPEVSSKASDFTLQKNETLVLQGDELTLKTLTALAGSRIMGFGKITVTESFSIKADCVIDLSEIEVVIQSFSLVLPTATPTLPSLSTMEVGERSTLILRDYPIAGTGSRVSINFVDSIDSMKTVSVVLKAPCRQIFKNIKVTGKILTEEAYPEWFASDDATAGTDWADAINKAFALTGNGVVRLQSKLYTVASTIYVPVRGQLLGTGSGW